MSTVTLRIPDKVLDAIAAETKRRRITKAKVMQERLSQPAQPTMWNLVKDLVVDDPNSPGDLSTNKRHMEGYGRNNPR
jgi:hypothetical protein